ncbi:MAG TPA: UvrD-helicase domain-containing protein [Terracidiphilus sp.]|nr:UvrD-helicase domain-containing protein [Terracidiphilus sp.]
MSRPVCPDPPDQLERLRALHPGRSILVQAPAGSGKTDLLARRFLRLLGEVDEPGQIVAITFTNAAAAEMRNRILDELRKAAADLAHDSDQFSMDALAHRALKHSQTLGWKLIDLPAQLRIRTIDSFCRELALQQPLLSGLGGGLNIGEQPEELYRWAARETLRKVDQTGAELGTAVEELLSWRDNGWQDMENLLVDMLKGRDRWMQGIVLEREPDWEVLRERLERPFAHAVHDALVKLSGLLDQVPNARGETLELARFACAQSGGQLHQELAELVELPAAPFTECASVEEARQAHVNLAALLLTGESAFRKQVDKRLGFPANCKHEKSRILELITQLAAVPGFETALSDVRNLPSIRYSDEEWKIVKACFTLLREAAAELRVVFAEAGAVDFTEVAQIAQRVLRGDDNLPTDAALGVSDNIRHLLVDEFQDTSRRQHQLLSSLIAAWPERAGRTCFVVGDPMQSIYFFRDADAELFPRVKALGLEIPHDQPLLFDSVSLTANFRTTPGLVERLNQDFAQIFAEDDGSGITFAAAQPARETKDGDGPSFKLHLEFVPEAGRGKSVESGNEREAAHTAQIEEIVELIHGHQGSVEQAHLAHELDERVKFRIAVLGRAKNHLVHIAEALREAGIPFRAVELEQLATRPEVLDALALARALLNPQDRVAWLGVLRAPWCGLSLEDLHRLAGSDEPVLQSRPVSELIAERLPLLSDEGRLSAAHVLDTLAAAPDLRAAHPTASLGTWLEQVWLRLGGAACVDATARANIDLLWSCLDNLMGGEPELPGPGLAAALDKLTALPDPGASSDYGVQLMTIHKSKGLEFEVVIVPELQARIRGSSRKMLSWLERGLAEPDDSGEITEFLVAPFQRKRADRSPAKEWVDRVYRERESQEDRRILYVAATRAREELHLFARPAFKEKDGELTLVEPTNSLLATAWPALEEEVRARFETWKAARAALVAPQSQEIDTLAASGESNLAILPPPIRPTLLRRLPPEYRPSPAESTRKAATEPSVLGMGKAPAQLYSRHEGGLLSRALGTAVHALLEELARLRARLDWEAARSALRPFEPHIAAQARSIGVDQPQASQIAAEALQLAIKASNDPIGSWILSPHAAAASEAAWAGVVAGGLHAVRVDRVFRAGPTPSAKGEDCWWIIDYKTTHAGNLDPAQALPELRQLFAPQLGAYASILRNLQGGDASGCSIRAGLYYPRLSLLDWWEI